MSTHVAPTPSPLDLRRRAGLRLAPRAGSVDATASMSAALAVLHDLAASPATAADAMALLHELQVHQVELDLQAEELRSARTELEEALAHQLARIDAAPVGLFTVDLRSVVHEVNAPGARMLGLQADQLLGEPLSKFLAPQGADALATLLALAGSGQAEGGTALQLLPQRGDALAVHATAARLADHGQCQLALMHVAA